MSDIPVSRRARASRAGSGRLGTVLAAPGLLLLLGVFVVPMALLAVLSFGKPGITGSPTLENGLTLKNFDLVFSAYNLPVVWRTLIFAVAVTVICGVVGYAVAYFAAFSCGRYGIVIMALVLIPWFVNYLVRIYAWRSITAETGLLNTLLGSLGMEPVRLLGTPAMVIVGLVYSSLPLMILPIYASLTQMNRELIEAGRDLYGGRFVTFVKVTLPASREGIVGGVLLVFLPTLGDFATAQFLGGASSTMIGNLIADQFMQAGSQPFGAALTTLLVLSLVAAVLVSRLAGRNRARKALQL